MWYDWDDRNKIYDAIQIDSYCSIIICNGMRLNYKTKNLPKYGSCFTVESRNE